MKFNVYSVEPVTENIVGIPFVNGKAKNVDNTIDLQRRALEYFQRQGYRIEPAEDEENAGEQFGGNPELKGNAPAPTGTAAPSEQTPVVDNVGTPTDQHTDGDAGLGDNPPVNPPSRSASRTIWLDYITSDAAGSARLDTAAAEQLTRDEMADRVHGPKGA